MAPSTNGSHSIEATLRGVLSDDAATAYAQALDSRGSISSSSPYLPELLAHGLVRAIDSTGRLQAIPPEAAVTYALHTVTARWLASAPKFDGVLRSIDRLAGVPPVADGRPIDDAATFQRTVEGLLVSAQTSLWCMQPYPEWKDDEEIADQSTSIRNHETSPAHVAYRFIYDQRLLKFASMREAAMEEIAQGCEVRFANWQLPTFMMIMDTHTALFFPHGDTRGELSDDPGHVALLCLAYEAAFTRAVPLLDEPTLTPIHQQVHTFLALGHGTRLIGSMLKLNERTVRRRVRELMEHHGVTNQHELIALAVNPTVPANPVVAGPSA